MQKGFSEKILIIKLDSNQLKFNLNSTTLSKRVQNLFWAAFYCNAITLNVNGHMSGRAGVYCPHRDDGGGAISDSWELRGERLAASKSPLTHCPHSLALLLFGNTLFFISSPLNCYLILLWQPRWNKRKNWRILAKTEARNLTPFSRLWMATRRINQKVISQCFDLNFN